jgi:hypothetical protein
MRTIPILVVLVAGLAAAQQSKPAKPLEAIVHGKKVSLAVPPDWVDAVGAGTGGRGDWKLVKGWESPSTKGLAIRVFGAEGKDLTPASLTQKWIESIGKGKPELVVSVAGKNKTLKGLDTEAEIVDAETYSFYWLRVIALPPKDKVIVVLAEIAPLDRQKLQAIMAEVQPVLDSVFDPTGKDPWRRDPGVTVTAGELVTRVTAPTGWIYARRAPEGSLAWSDPAGSQEVELDFPLRSVRFRDQPAFMNMAAPMLYKVITDGEAEVAEKNGKLLKKATVPGHDQASDLTMVTEVESVGPTWVRRRLLLDGGNLTSLAAKHPVPDLGSLPTDAFQKQVAAFMDSLKLEIVRGK